MILQKCNDRIQKWMILFVLIVFVILLGMQSNMSIFSNGISGTDSSVFRYVAYMMQHGYVPYKDTFDHKGPLLYIIDYIGMQLHPTRGIWLIELAALFISVWFSYKLARLFASRLTSLLSVITAYILLADCLRGGNSVEEYAIPFIAVSLYFFADYILHYDINGIGILLCGSCFAAVCLLRINMIAIWIVGVLVVLSIELYKKQWKKLWKECAFFLTGAAVLAIPILGYLLYHHAFVDFWDNYIAFNLSYSGYLDMRQRLDCYQFFVAQPLVYLAFAGILHQIYRGKKEGIDIRLLILFSGSLLVSFLFTGMSGRKDINYETALIPVLVVPICYFYMPFIDYNMDNRKNSSLTYFVLFWVVSTLIMPFMLKIWNRGLDQNRFLTKQEDKWLTEVQEAVATYCDVEDRISVFGNKDIIYLLCDKFSASRYSFQFPIVEIRREIYQEYICDLEQNLPKIIVIDTSFAAEYEEIFKEWLAQQNYKVLDEEETIYVHA